MEYVTSILGMIDFEAIRQLDLRIKGPGMALAAFFLYRAFRSIFSISPVSLVMNLVYAVVITVLLSQWGGLIQQMALPAIESFQNGQTGEETAPQSPAN